MRPSRLYDKVAQLLFPRIGSNLDPCISVEDDAPRIEALIKQCPIGGLVLFNGDRYRTPQTLARLQAASQLPLLIGTDMERGLGQQLTGATIFPHAYAFDALGEEAELKIEEAARTSAREALAAGIHISFSPVADVHSNPLNPIISTRAFGSDPRNVSERVAAHIRGCQAEGLLSTAKHFPGHGDTSTDSHEELPIVQKSIEELEQTELMPFRVATESNVDLIMTAHVAYPALDESGIAATYSRPILTDLLRDDLHFRGAVITDSLLMEGARDQGEHPGAWAADLLLAGVDILLDVADPEATADYLVTAVRSGALDEARIDEACDRVLALKQRMTDRFGKGIFLDPLVAFPLSIIGCDKHRACARSIAQAAVCTITGSIRDVRLSRETIRQRGLLVALVRPHTTYNDPTAASLETFIRREFKFVKFVEVTPESKEVDLEKIVEKAPEYGGVVIAVVVKPAAWHRFGLLPAQSRFVEDVIDACPVVLAALGSPIVLEDFPKAALGICTFSDVADSQQALVERLASITSKDDSTWTD